MRKLRYPAILAGAKKCTRWFWWLPVIDLYAIIKVNSVDFPLSPRVMMAPRAKSRRHLRVAFGFLGLDLSKIGAQSLRTAIIGFY